MDISINSEEDLYNMIKPALRCKKHELLLQNILIKEEDIWDYCKDNIFIKMNDLNLYQVVDVILNTNDNKYHEYMINKLRIKEDVI